MSEREMLAKEARKYELLDNLTRQDGWKVLLQHLDQLKSVIVKALIIEKDYNKVITLQERYRAFDSVISTLQSAKSIKEKLFDDINRVLEDEKLREEFDI